MPRKLQMSKIVQRSFSFSRNSNSVWLWSEGVGKWPRGLRCCSQHQEVLSSNLTRCLVVLRDPTLLRGSQWPLDQICKKAVINIRQVINSLAAPQEWSTVLGQPKSSKKNQVKHCIWTCINWSNVHYFTFWGIKL